MKSDQQVMQDLMRPELQKTFRRHAKGHAIVGLVGAVVGVGLAYTGGFSDGLINNGLQFGSLALACSGICKLLTGNNAGDYSETLADNKNRVANNVAAGAGVIGASGFVGTIAYSMLTM